MDKFNIEEFNPTKQELIKLVESYKGLRITDLKDKVQIELVKKAKKDLADKRNYITKTLKTVRDGAIKFQKDVIAKEKELVSIIEEVENVLKSDLENLEMQEEIEKRKQYLPIMIEELQKIGLDKEYQPDFLLSMNFGEFESFLQREKSRLFDEKQAKENEEKIKKERADELERVRQQAEAKAKIETEERMRKEQEQKQIAEKEAKEKLENKQKEEEAVAKKNKAFTDWLKANDYDEKTDRVDKQFDGEGFQFSLYRLVDTIYIS